MIRMSLCRAREPEASFCGGMQTFYIFTQRTVFSQAPLRIRMR